MLETSGCLEEERRVKANRPENKLNENLLSTELRLVTLQPLNRFLYSY